MLFSSLLRFSAHAAAFTGALFFAGGCTEAPPPPAPVPPTGTQTPTSEPVTSATAASSASASPSAGVAGASSAAGATAAASTTAAASAAPAVPAPVAGTRIWGKSRFTWIHPAPQSNGGWIGYLGLGGSAPLKGGDLDKAKAVGSGCGGGGWFAIEPSGFVCAGDTASVDPAEEVTAALIRDAGKADSPWPFEYGESLGTPRYTRIPTPAEMRKSEWDLVVHLEKVARARDAKTPEELVAIDKTFEGMDFSFAGQTMPEIPPVSPYVREGRAYVVSGSTVAWVRAFDVEFPGGEYGLKKRTFLLTSDFAFVPKDRVKPYPRSQFKGVALTGEVKLPIAFFRKVPRPKYRKSADGTMAPTGESWPARSWTMVTGEEVTAGKERFVAMREEGIFAKAEDATVIAAAAPPSTKITEQPGRGTWLDVSVLGGWLVAYEKTKPVFVTLISPGRGGVPFPGKDAVSTASTPLGNFRVDGKFLWATMVSSSNSDIVHTEVQYVQNFHGPHALHGAYWHEVFGEPKSGGCINLSPIDSKWVFEFTEPALPPGWHGMRSVDAAGYATIVSVHR